MTREGAVEDSLAKKLVEDRLAAAGYTTKTELKLT
jgi:hypothetical protein